MKITISDTILSGTMGDGWADQHDAATGYAEYASEKLAEVVRDQYPGAEVETDFDVQYATGCTRGLSVDVETDDIDQKFEIENDLTDYLNNYYDRVWSAWCGGDGSEYFGED